MKIYRSAFLFLIVLLYGCLNNNEVTPEESKVFSPLEVPERITLKSQLKREAGSGLWTLDQQLYSGYVISYYPDSSLKEKFGILEGRKQNEATQWYDDGHLKNVSNYYQGKLHGEKKTWSDDSAHVLLAHYHFYQGKGHGEQTKWYPTGELYKKLNYEHGIEKGIQQAYRKNGALYANYEAKNGRIFGLKKATLCFGLEDQKIKGKE